MSDIEIIREALHFCSDVHGERTAQAVDATGALDRLATRLRWYEGLQERYGWVAPQPPLARD